ncbi:hypothetical protein SPRG_10834 [Saprolegnia parasitica CBS 223.65]|uniref:Transmembrane protein 218 n=1 Tax=Saprolegnia parasitica (strain CBS 223.65) TaxID=695850 RepID=A0A067CBX5_SAPPC|nr:hypothetical protein SPRG_10834 [Saprolegnia parasitica CBS 223.65]KDO24046.1 hypothetical protein SPRG_10834 [Saprolegnia parasitica CBS 223.65]|eukprot:XP_012205183.1 hypothetical protein SPRG_10834 [Saprolegnia parasitica CBS 223.65]
MQRRVVLGLLLLALVRAQTPSSSSSSTPLIVGPGLFGLILVFLFLCGYSSAHRCGLFVLIASIIASTVVFFLTVKVTAPGQASVHRQEYNNKGVTRAFVRAVLIASAVVALLSVFLTHVVSPRHARRLGEWLPQRARPRQF